MISIRTIRTTIMTIITKMTRTMILSTVTPISHEKQPILLVRWLT